MPDTAPLVQEYAQRPRSRCADVDLSEREFDDMRRRRPGTSANHTLAGRSGNPIGRFQPRSSEA
jgi:hypothetical protein